MAESARGYAESEQTPWFNGAVEKPVRIGRYRTSRQDIMHYGSAYSWWNGAAWEPFETWGQYHQAPKFVWRGLLEGVR